MFNNPYNYNYQANLERINNQIAELERMKNQISSNPPPQPTNLTQNFQLAPTNNSPMRFANSIEDVKKEVVVANTPYFSNDLSVVWVKSIKGDIKAYEMKEIVEKDEKDIKIDYLTAQLEDLKRRLEDESNTIIDKSIKESTEDEEPTSSSNVRTGKKKQ